MKILDLNIKDWQSLVDRFKASGKNKKPDTSVALRIENTQLSIARHYGGITYNGEHYTFFAPRIPGETNADGTPKCAWLIVRDDFLRWAAKEVKEEGGAK